MESSEAICLHNLLIFLQDLSGLENMYTKYAKKLFTLHIHNEDWVQAGFTLLKFARMKLNWSSKPLDHDMIWDFSNFSLKATHFALKVCAMFALKLSKIIITKLNFLGEDVLFRQSLTGQGRHV